MTPSRPGQDQRNHAGVLIVKPGSMGDVIHALPVAAALKAAKPGRNVSWIVDTRWLPLLENNPCVDSVIEFPRNRFRGIAGLGLAAKWFLNLRSLEPDLAIDLQGLFRSAMMTRLARPKTSIGLSDAREGAAWMVQHCASVSGVRHAVDRYLQVLPRCGIPIPDKPAFPLPPHALVPEVPDNAIAIHPFARGHGKSISPEMLRYLCVALAPKPVILCGMGQPPNNLPDNVTDLTNATTLPQLLGLIHQTRGLISVDSGPMHLAAAIGRPLIAIHTWSDPAKVGPYSNSAWIWQGGSLRPQNLQSFEPTPPEQSITTKAIDQIAAHARNWTA